MFNLGISNIVSNVASALIWAGLLACVVWIAVYRIQNR